MLKYINNSTYIMNKIEEYYYLIVNESTIICENMEKSFENCFGKKTSESIGNFLSLSFLISDPKLNNKTIITKQNKQTKKYEKYQNIINCEDLYDDL